jgi:hypothetical protein
MCDIGTGYHSVQLARSFDRYHCGIMSGGTGASLKVVARNHHAAGRVHERPARGGSPLTRGSMAHRWPLARCRFRTERRDKFVVDTFVALTTLDCIQTELLSPWPVSRRCNQPASSFRHLQPWLFRHLQPWLQVYGAFAEISGFFVESRRPPLLVAVAEFAGLSDPRPKTLAGRLASLHLSSSAFSWFES